MDNLVNEKFGGKIRIRCCALIVIQNKILLLNHAGLTPEDEFWSPPGGGLEKRESILTCLKREVVEETNLNISNPRFLFFNEYIEGDLHAMELFFNVEIEQPENFILGSDPELSAEQQLIKGVKWLDFCEIELNKNIYHPALLKNKNLILSAL